MIRANKLMQKWLKGIRDNVNSQLPLLSNYEIYYLEQVLKNEENVIHIKQTTSETVSKGFGNYSLELRVVGEKGKAELTEEMLIQLGDFVDQKYYQGLGSTISFVWRFSHLDDDARPTYFANLSILINDSEQT